MGVNVTELCLHNLFESGSSEDEQISPSFLIGVILSFASSSFTNLGANVQKWALNKELERPIHKRRSMFKIPVRSLAEAPRSLTGRI